MGLSERFTESRVSFHFQVDKRPEKFAYKDIKDGQLFRTQSATLEAVHTPGHTTDHVSFILREERVSSGIPVMGHDLARSDLLRSPFPNLERKAWKLG